MSTTRLLEDLPDLVVLMRRDGIVLSCYGGRGVGHLRPSIDPAGKHLEDLWSDSMTQLIRRLIREAVARRATARAAFEDGGHRYGLRVSAQGIDRAVCVIRGLPDVARTGTHEALGALRHFKRRASPGRPEGSLTPQAELHASARLQVARELRGELAGERRGVAGAQPIDLPIADGHVALSYVGRHELSSGRLVAWVGHLCWRHGAHGELSPLELVRLAEITGLAAELSRAALRTVQNDYRTVLAGSSPDVRISFGPSRHHVLEKRFVPDIERFLDRGIVPAERLELRISVKTAFARKPTDFRPLADRGVQIIVDDIGRGMDLPLAWLARAPVKALQLNRAWVQALSTDTTANRLCRAGVGVAAALGLFPLAVSVDQPMQRDALLDAGCLQGTGELYRDRLLEPVNIITERAEVAAA